MMGNKQDKTNGEEGPKMSDDLSKEEDKSNDVIHAEQVDAKVEDEKVKNEDANEDKVELKQEEIDNANVKVDDFSTSIDEPKEVEKTDERVEEDQNLDEIVPEPLKENDDDNDEVDSDDEEDTSDWPATEVIARAESCKESGNECFKNGENEEAINFYSKGIKYLSKLDDMEPPLVEEGIKVKHISLSISSELNKAAASNKLGNWKDAIKSATNAIKFLEHNHRPENHKVSRSKALYRRGYAKHRLSDLDGAKADLVVLLKADKRNKEALREYNEIKIKLAKFKKDEKAQYAAAFKKASENGGMYRDKEIERKRKALQKIEEERKRRKEWKDQIEKNGTPDLSFDDWCKEDDKKKEEERKEKEKLESERREKEAETRRKQRLEKEKNKKDDDIELDEEDLKAIAETKKKGYCYFRREQTEEEKALLKENSTPSKLVDDTIHQTSSASSASAWNSNGTTWEERDVTKAATEQLENILKSVVVERDDNLYIASVDKVESVKGHAQIVVSRAKPAPLFDLEAKLKWVIKNKQQDKVLAKGSMHFTDITNGIESETYELSNKVKKNDIGDGTVLSPLLNAFEHELRTTIHQYVSNDMSTL